MEALEIERERLRKAEREEREKRVKRQKKEDGRRYLSNGEGKSGHSCALTCHVTSSSDYYKNYIY